MMNERREETDRGMKVGPHTGESIQMQMEREDR